MCRGAIGLGTRRPGSRGRGRLLGRLGVAGVQGGVRVGLGSEVARRARLGREAGARGTGLARRLLLSGARRRAVGAGARSVAAELAPDGAPEREGREEIEWGRVGGG